MIETEEKYIPATLIECFEIVRQEVDPEDWEQLKNRSHGRFQNWDHHLGWGIYLRNRFLNPRHSPLRPKFQKIFPIFQPDPISSFMFELLWIYASDQELNASIVKSILEKPSMVNPLQRNLELRQIEDLLGKSTS